MNNSQLPKFAYPVRNTLLEHDDLYLIPATATHIWVEGAYKGDLEFSIYADIVYRETTPMFCGDFGVPVEFDNLFFCLTEDSSRELKRQLEILADDVNLLHRLAECVVKQIATRGEVDCEELSDYAKRVLDPSLAELKDKYARTKQD